MLTYSQLQMMYDRLSKKYSKFKEKIELISENLLSEEQKNFINSAQSKIEQYLQIISVPQILDLDIKQERQLAELFPDFFYEYTQMLSKHYDYLKKGLALLFLLESMIEPYL